MRKRSTKARARVAAAEAQARLESATGQFAPAVTSAVHTATDVVQSARDRVVDDFLPRIADAAAAAASAAAEARDTAMETAQDKTQLALAYTPANIKKAKKKRRRRRLLLLTAIGAGAAAGVAAYRSKGQSHDPWTPASSATTFPVKDTPAPGPVPPVVEAPVTDAAAPEAPSLDDVSANGAVVTDQQNEDTKS